MTSKVVSKAEGRVVAGEPGRGDRPARRDRVVARRGPTDDRASTASGLTMAAAGVDASNVEPGHVVLLPDDPDASARGAARGAAPTRRASTWASLVTDTAGRAWREGQTDIAVGAAGLEVLDDHAGRTDALRQRARS